MIDTYLTDRVVTDWESEFKLKYTMFDKAFDEIITSDYKDYRSGHEE